METRDHIADNREDFMRRWFAIAISVGFATTVVNMKWVQSGALPQVDEWKQLFRLLAALVATVLSWEGYLLSIKTKRLYEFPRYFIDISLVFIYLFLLLTSKYEHFWLLLHALTFVLYAIWDGLTLYWHRDWYGADERTMRSAYWNSLLGRNGVDRGIAITLSWLCYFAWLWIVSWAEFKYETFVMMSFVLIGLAGYRLNKSDYRDSGWMTYLTPIGAGGALSLIVIFLQGS